MSMLRGAVVNVLAREQLHDFIEARLIDGFRFQLDAPTDSPLRAGVVASMLVGLVLSRCLFKVPILAQAEREHLIQIVAPAPFKPSLALARVTPLRPPRVPGEGYGFRYRNPPIMFIGLSTCPISSFGEMGEASVHL